MFEFSHANRRNQVDYILRLGHSYRRSPELIFGEVDWINYLAGHGIGVARAIPSQNGNLVEAIDDGGGGQFLATAFVKAQGGPPSAEHWNEALFERYGRLLGRMHLLSKTYQPADPSWRRPEWNDPEMFDMEDWLPPGEPAVRERYHRLKAHLDGLPRDHETYGLVHQDAHGGNFFVDEDGRITLFDFDDCVYSWYANDLAIVLFYAVVNHADPEAAAQAFLTPFLRGYSGENRLDPAWLTEFPHFLKLREIDLYAVIHRSFDVDNLDHPWVSAFMDGRKARIEDGRPFLDLDISQFASIITSC